MPIRRPIVAAVALAAAALTTAALLDATAAGASSPARVPVVTVHMSNSAVVVTNGAHHLHAGSIIFKVEAASGDHELQIARLRSSYSLRQAGSDIGKALGGDVAAVRRVDSNITFRGGAEATRGHPGYFAVKLYAGDYVFLDQDSNAYVVMHIFGTPPARATVPRQATVTTYTYGFGITPATLPASGWIRVQNVSDQPHFVALNQVKANTTAAMVRHYFASHTQAQPSFALRGAAGSGVISPYVGEVLHYSVPPGKYLMACYWPDDDTGMPHAAMGMWRFVTVR